MSHRIVSFVRLFLRIGFFVAGSGASLSFVTLSPEQEARARRLHDESIIIIDHTHNFSRQDLLDAQAGGVTAVEVQLITDGIDWDRTTRTRYGIAGLTGWK